MLSGCGNDTTASNLPKYSTPSSTPLPEEFRVLASHLSLEMKSDPVQFRNKREMTDVMVELQSAILDLSEIKSKDKEILYLSDQVRDADTVILQRLNNLNSLPKPPDEGTLFAGSILDGFFGNFGGSYQRGLNAETKQNALNVELQSLIAAVDKRDAAHQLLPKVAEKYSATLSDSTALIIVDFNESWGYSGPDDWLVLQNLGETLEDCTILVQLTGANGEVRKNVHFLKTWPAYTCMWGQYYAGKEVLGRTVEKMTVAYVQKLEVTIYSPQFATQIHYVYKGAEKDKDVAHLCRDLSFQGAYQPYESGILWDTQRGAQFTMDGVSFLPKCRVDVTFRKGDQSKVWYWEHDSWMKGESKKFTTPAGGLEFEPDNIDFEVSFPDTNYKHKATLPVALASKK
tara:strand:+ start:40165 stop:41364 length:1200 start_codon:yes stop_codon:yes gene_type:complete